MLLELARDAKGLNGLKNMAKDSLISIDKRKIICFMTDPDERRAVIAYTTDGNRMVFSGSLNHIEAELNDKLFYRCKKNLIVNLGKIINIDKIANQIMRIHG